jgi:5-methylcytosine-specific restriction endonuclease McrA
MRAYRKRHPDKIRERNQRNYARRGEEIRAQARQWHIDHPGHVVARNQRWRHAHAEQNLAGHQRNRAVKLGISGPGVTGDEWAEILARFGNRCLACGSTGRLTMDHIVPYAAGGWHGPDNVQPLCKNCNSRKHTSTIDYRPTVQGAEA